MNLASILPCATVRPGGATGTVTTAAPAGFLDVLAAQSSTTGTALPLGEGELAEGGTEEGAAEDLLALAALASRTAHAALPQVLPSETTTPAPADASVAGVEPTVAPATASTSPLAGAGELVATVPAEDTVTTVPAVPGGAVPPADVRTAEVPTVAEGAAGPVPAADATDTVDQASDADVQDAAPSDTTPATATAGRPDAAVPAAGADAAVPGEGLDATAAGEELPAQPAAAPVGPSERQRGRAEATPSRTGLEGARAVEGDAAVAPAPTGGAPGAGRADALTPSSAAQRVLDLVSQLEDAPPPRVVVIETGEIRLRIGLDAGTVRLTVLGQLGEAGEEILRETTDALEAGGFGTELDRGTGEGAERGRGHDAHDRDVPGAAGPHPARPGSRSRGGLQL